jgi:hypothetical protein
VVVGGDLNFIMGVSEIWGIAAQEDCLLRLFLKKLEEVGLLDVEPTKLTPTWTNRRIGEAHIAKRLDRFWISKSILKEATRIKHWVSLGGELDHHPIMLEIAPT